jgi:hypothetical protein
MTAFHPKATFNDWGRTAIAYLAQALRSHASLALALGSRLPLRVGNRIGAAARKRDDAILHRPGHRQFVSPVKCQGCRFRDRRIDSTSKWPAV